MRKNVSMLYIFFHFLHELIFLHVFSLSVSFFIFIMHEFSSLFEHIIKHLHIHKHTKTAPIIIQQEPINPCVPSPCGPNSQCRDTGHTAVCSCVQNYIGRPPNCRPECTSNSECPSHLACINERCKDPCPGSCGHYASCSVTGHQPICRCQDQYTGDPFTGCHPLPSKKR